jgi:hypothetical protein
LKETEKRKDKSLLENQRKIYVKGKKGTRGGSRKLYIMYFSYLRKPPSPPMLSLM